MLDGDNYYLFCADSEVWTTANTVCSMHGYDALTSIQDSTENELLRVGPPNTSVTPVGYWIGYNDRSIEGDFVWSDGSLSSYTNWDFLQPDDDGGEDCVYLNPGSGLWNDDDCSTPKGFICVSRM